MSKYLKALIGLTLPALLFFWPSDSGFMVHFSVIEQRVMSIFLLATLFWILEPIPIYATSLVIIVAELLTLSDKGFVLFQGEDTPEFGTTLTYKEIMGTFASPIILLFLGGFFLARAATKYRLDQNLARVLLKPFGSSPKKVMLGLMLITAIFSMFMSNTATTAMMLAILAPVLSVFEEKDHGKVGFALCIPMAANLGGIGTQIGTPPNAIAMKYLSGENYVSFAEWMVFGVPTVVVLLFISWIILNKMYPTQTPKINLQISGQFQRNRKAYTVYAVFAGTILLWLTDFLHGMNSYVVATIPVAVFSATGIITKNDLKTISWDVLWLVSGGIALGLALEKSGLASHVVNMIPFDTWPSVLILVSITLLAMIMANFMSNTATANLLLPITAALGTSLSGIEELGGSKLLLLSVTLATSLGMALPISTPPNALAHATGLVNTGEMARIGVLMAVIGVIFVFALIWFLKLVGF